MQKLDRLGWAAGVCFRSYGLRIGIRANNVEVLEQAKGRIPSGWKPAKSPIVDNLYSIVAPRATDKPHVKRFSLLYRGIGTLARTTDLDEAMEELEIHLHAYVAAATRQRLFLHAGVVGWRGRAIVIPGKNFSGKTSLVTAFLRAGATYYSDEFAVLDSRGRVHPYPWALHIREEGLTQPRACPVETLGGRVGTEALPIGLVLLSDYRRGARWQPHPVTKGQAALAILSTVVSVRHRPQATLSLLSEIVASAKVLKGARGEAEEVVDSILSAIVD